MKQLLLGALTIFFLSSTYNAAAQKRKARIHKAKHGKKGVVHSRKKGKTAVVRKTNLHVHKTNRKRIKRTKVVHYHYRHLPRRGAIVAAVNSAALTINHGSVGFRFHSGIWYRPRGSKWIVTKPPLRASIRVLPIGYRKIVIGPSNYYYYYGTYYVKKNDEYEVVEAPLNAEVSSLPDGYNTIKIDGNEYYELDDIYYMPSVDENNEEVLVVVENPAK